MNKQEKILHAKIKEKLLDWKLEQIGIIMKTLDYSFKDAIQFIETILREDD